MVVGFFLCYNTRMDKKIFQSKVTTIYILYTFTVFLWYTHYKYLDIMQAKRMVFLFGTAIYDTIMLICSISAKFGQDEQHKNTIHWYKILSIMMITGWIFSTIGSLDRTEAIWGYGGKCTGLLVYLLGLIAAMYICEYLQWSPVITWGMLLSVVVICGLQVLNRWGIDPLEMYTNIMDDQKRLFISTIGQVNYNASLNCMILGAIMGLYLLCEKRISQVVYGIALAFVYAGSICCCSDSAYLGILLVLLVHFVYVGAHPDKWRRFVQENIILAGVIIALWFIWNCIDSVFVWDITLLLFDTRILWRLLLLLTFFLVISTFILWLEKIKKIHIWRGYCIGIMIYAPAQLVLIVAKVMTEPEYWNTIATWMGYRVEIWKRCWRTFEVAPVWNKMWGYGFNNIDKALANIGGAEFGNSMIADAHNIVINTLVTSGIVGTILWIVMLGLMLVKAIRHIEKNKECLLVISGILGYCLQGMVNGPQIFTTPILLVGMGIWLNMIQQDEK